MCEKSLHTPKFYQLWRCACILKQLYTSLEQALFSYNHQFVNSTRASTSLPLCSFSFLSASALLISISCAWQIKQSIHQSQIRATIFIFCIGPTLSKERLLKKGINKSNLQIFDFVNELYFLSSAQTNPPTSYFRYLQVKTYRQHLRMKLLKQMIVF